MDINDFIKEINVGFYTGVPDSQLQALCDYLYRSYGIGKEHIVAANEGGAIALAAGYYLSTGNIPCVYMQNSGIGNAINPICSLTNNKVYGIPMVLVIGWRGEPGVHDEPQHIFQGEKTVDLLSVLEIPYFIISRDTELKELREEMQKFKKELAQGKTVAFVVRKGGLSYAEKAEYSNQYSIKRERAIELIAAACGSDTVIVSTTGKASRELFEIRKRRKEDHKKDFLTVGSMGHSSMIGLEIALQNKNKKVCVIDGDGAVLMHMGSMAVIGSEGPANFVHIILNNSAHETVGGMPTAFEKLDCSRLALSLGYKKVWVVEDEDKIEETIKNAMSSVGPSMIEIRVSLGARKDLGRPTKSPQENKKAFMDFLKA